MMVSMRSNLSPESNRTKQICLIVPVNNSLATDIFRSEIIVFLWLASHLFWDIKTTQCSICVLSTSTSNCGHESHIACELLQCIFSSTGRPVPYIVCLHTMWYSRAFVLWPATVVVVTVILGRWSRYQHLSNPPRPTTSMLSVDG